MIDLKEDTQSKKIEQMRLETLSKVNMMTRLTDERYFDQVMESIKENDDAKFLEICKNVGIHKEMGMNLWKIIRARETVYADTWM